MRLPAATPPAPARQASGLLDCVQRAVQRTIHGAVRPGLIGAALLAAALPAAQAQVVPIRWSADGRFAHQGTVAAGKWVELCGKLPAGHRVAWSFDAAGPLDFNLHYHQGKAVVTPARLVQASQGRQTLLTQVAQDYCWMWTNKASAGVDLTVLLVQ